MPALFVLCCNQLKHSVHSSNLLSHFRKISLVNANEVLLVNPNEVFTKLFGSFWQYKSGQGYKINLKIIQKEKIPQQACTFCALL